MSYLKKNLNEDGGQIKGRLVAEWEENKARKGKGVGLPGGGETE